MSDKEIDVGLLIAVVNQIELDADALGDKCCEDARLEAVKHFNSFKENMENEFKRVYGEDWRNEYIHRAEGRKVRDDAIIYIEMMELGENTSDEIDCQVFCKR